MEELFDTVRPSLLVVSLQGQQRPALLRTALDWAVVYAFVLVYLYSLLISLSMHADKELL